VCDLGVGFRSNAHRKTGQALSATQAISWAAQDGHTSRTGAIPGGLGIGLLREFVLRNRGSLQIVSEDGYWLFDGKGEHSWELRQAFPGTFVNLRIMTNDEALYKAAGEAGELDAEEEGDIDIFGPSPKIEAHR
jgi:ketosteroid isomerase-like protein